VAARAAGCGARVNPGVLAAMELARDTAQTTMSGQTTLDNQLGSPADRLRTAQPAGTCWRFRLAWWGSCRGRMPDPREDWP
jgi:hypothetical protein